MCKATLLILNVLIVSSLSMGIRVGIIKIDYNKTKVIVQNCLNGVLNLLDVEVPASRKPKLRLLAVMQNNLNNIVHYKWKVYSEMQYIAKAEESFDLPLQLYEYVETAMTDIEKENPINKTTIRNLTFTNDTDTSSLFTVILCAINNLNVTIDNVRNNSNASVGNQETHVYRRLMDDDDLEVWEPDEEQENNARRVYGGKRVGISQYPFLVSIHILGKFKGTGCIINKNFVITAASCIQTTDIYRGERSPIQIRIGSDQTSSGGDLLPAAGVVFHPRYDSISLENNLAIIKVKYVLHSLKRPSIKKIRIGSLPDTMSKNFATKGVFVLGWRIFPEDATGTSQLSSTFLDMTSLDVCMDVYTTRLVKGTHFCAGLVYKGSGACNGDVGSPAIAFGSLVGLVNFGPPTCGTMTSPTVFTKLAYYSSWITEVLQEDKEKIHFKSGFNFEESNNKFINQDSPEEILILRQLVHEINKPNNKIEQLIEEDKEIDDEMKVLFQSTSTTVLDAAHHSLVNKSIILVPGVNVQDYVTEAPYHVSVTPYVTEIIDIGLPANLPYGEIDGVVQNSDELRYFVHDILTQGTEFVPDEVQHYLGLDLRAVPKRKREKKSVESDSNDNFEYETDEGLSIEFKNKKGRLDKSPRAFVSRKPGIVLDLGTHNIQLGMRDKKYIPVKSRPDFWSEVMRLKRKTMKLNIAKPGKKPLKYNKPKPVRFRSIPINKHDHPLWSFTST